MRIGFLVFERVTQLDLTGPFEVFASLRDAELLLISHQLTPVHSDRGLVLTPTSTYATSPPCHILVVPGGPGINTLLNDQPTLEFLQRASLTSRYLTSVCTGSLLLAAAGLLQGHRAATHWNAHTFLAQLGAIPVAERTVIDGPFVTGGGVTAGIDFALTLVAHIYGQDLAERIQLSLEYQPNPPFNSGSPETARPEILAAYQTEALPMITERTAAVARARQRLIESGKL